MDNASVFQTAIKAFEEKQYYDEFRSYIQMVGNNGVSENARYFFFIVRRILHQSSKAFSDFYKNYLAHYKSDFLYGLYYGGPMVKVDQLKPAREERYTDI